MSKFIASVAVYNYRTNILLVETFRTNCSKDWKSILFQHSEFYQGGNLDWLNDDYNKAHKQLDSNDIQIDISFTSLNDDET